MSRIFIMNGQGTAGKGEFVKAIQKYDKEITGIPSRITYTSIIDRIKFIALSCGWQERKENKDRLFLHNLKKLLENYNDLPYRTIYNFIKQSEACKINDVEIYPYIFVDMREADDIARAVKDFGATTILIKKKEVKKFDNAADDNVFNWQYDYVIENYGSLQDLQDSAQMFWDEQLKKYEG